MLSGSGGSSVGGSGGFLLAVGFQEGVKDYIGKYGVVVIQVVVGCVLSMNVKSFNRVQMGPN
jgi:hypothetical protein